MKRIRSSLDDKVSDKENSQSGNTEHTPYEDAPNFSAKVFGQAQESITRHLYIPKSLRSKLKKTDETRW